MTPQQTIAHYRITAKLGEGGMGAVYRATDTKLGREVAIKILPEAFADDADRMARFEREAQVLASLNHPNIAAIYGVEERALVMELVPGPTLAERIAQGPVPLEEALPIAHQIADALEYAHERGIIHRDLKPANIKVTPEGRVKVLDFGLAKALSSESASADPMSSPTLTMRATLAGTILGTAAYMSPEQARGQAVDKRADIWAFGVVLYEMLTGHALFNAPTVSDTLAAVLRADPDWSALPDGLPANFRAMLQRSLTRDPKRRLRDIGDARLELEQPAAEPAATPPTARAARRSVLVPWFAAAVLALVAAALAVVHFRESPPAEPLVRFGVAPPEKGNFNAWLAVSPDGRNLAFTATGADGIDHVWLRSLDSIELRPLAGTEEQTITFFWSPDSRFIAFQAAGKLKKIDIAGGPPQTLCDAPGVMLGGTWNADGVILFGSNVGPILRVSSAGGIAEPVTTVDPSRDESNHTDPSFLPDGRHFLYIRRSTRPDYTGIYAGSVDVKPARQSLRRILASEFSPAYAPPIGSAPAQLLFLREDSLLAQPFDDHRLETVGEAVPIAEGIGTSITRAFFSVSANGVLVYRGGGAGGTQLSWYDRAGRPLGRAGDLAEYSDLALSPDNSRVAYSRPSHGGNRQVWVLDIARGTNTRLSFTPDGARSPVWSPGGKHIAFTSVRGAGIYIKDANGGGAERIVFRSPALSFVNDWSRDGRYLLYTEPVKSMNVLALPDPLAGEERKPIPVADSAFNETQGQFSPDSRWVAYASDETGRYEIYVRPFPSGDGRSGKWLVSSTGGTEPRWRADGKELYYMAPDHNFMAVDVQTEPLFQSATPHPLFPAPPSAGASILLFGYDVTRDGKRFLMRAPAIGEASSPAMVVLNWEAALKSR